MRRLDPLVASLTRMDDETRNAARMEIPMWGELILDRSLMVLVPVALFAVLGFGTSLLVILNSQDAIVDTLLEASAAAADPAVYLKGVAPPDVDPNVCRGLCGAQEENLEAMRAFMGGLAGNK